jgi:uncharacterized DUF497 family protein
MALMTIDGFDWDEGNREKCERHGLSSDEIEALLSGDCRVARDVQHSAREERFIAVGRTSLGRPVFVGFTFRTVGDRTLIRPVTARFMHKKEALRYEKTNRPQDDDR